MDGLEGVVNEEVVRVHSQEPPSLVQKVCVTLHRLAVKRRHELHVGLRRRVERMEVRTDMVSRMDLDLPVLRVCWKQTFCKRLTIEDLSGCSGFRMTTSGLFISTFVGGCSKPELHPGRGAHVHTSSHVLMSPSGMKGNTAL